MTMQMEMHDLREYKMRVSDDLGGVRRLFRWSCGPPQGLFYGRAAPAAEPPWLGARLCPVNTPPVSTSPSIPN